MTLVARKDRAAGARTSSGCPWQIVPIVLTEMLMDKDAQKVERATNAFLKMKKFDLAALKNAFDGRAAA
jgi:predicted 3-demethylubiquinone-9 3-methyltransferase (glyoxalase superfamily)